MVEIAISMEPKKNFNQFAHFGNLFIKLRLENLHSAISNEQDHCHKNQNQSQRTHEIGGEDFSSMLAVDFYPKGKFSLVLGFESLFFIPPSPATIKIIPDIRRADHRHTFTIIPAPRVQVRK